MAGLGIVPETLQLSKLPGYRIGGSVHVVINNQIGFTTMPEEGRSSVHATDCAKAAGIPVIHAYADCPESVVKVSDFEHSNSPVTVRHKEHMLSVWAYSITDLST